MKYKLQDLKANQYASRNYQRINQLRTFLGHWFTKDILKDKKQPFNRSSYFIITLMNEFKIYEFLKIESY